MKTIVVMVAVSGLLACSYAVKRQERDQAYWAERREQAYGLD